MFLYIPAELDMTYASKLNLSLPLTPGLAVLPREKEVSVKENMYLLPQGIPKGMCGGREANKKFL